MTTDFDADRFAAIAKQAEEAVAGVKDPELRRVAFEKILDTMLEARASTRPQPTKKVKGAGAKAPKVKGAKTARESSSGPKARIEELIQEGFFEEQRTIADVKAELANRGYHIPLTSLSGPLQTLVREKKLRRQKKADGKGAKGIFAYSNWG